MLLRVRVTLPDRPGTLGQVARTLGVSGADIVQVVVLERLGGRAVDDFTVVWPGAARVERMLAGLAAIPGVRVDGVWRAIGAPTTTGQDAELLAQVAANPVDGMATLVDAVPGLLAADWAVAAVVPLDWASRSGEAGVAAIGHASWRAPAPPRLPEVTPLRARQGGDPSLPWPEAE
ncbi:amino acid-binding protein, partial [Micromonospora sp. NPDC005313]|uniref:amino acid-binding protein n=1 Tax=Micromonospora sp. NPDC005313 TaxID=3154296 RepID=UPI0033B410C9